MPCQGKFKSYIIFGRGGGVAKSAQYLLKLLTTKVLTGIVSDGPPMLKLMRERAVLAP